MTGMLLAVSLVIQTAFGTYTAKAAENDKIVVYVSAEGTGEDGTTVKVKKTPVQLSEGETASTAIKEALGKSDYAANYVITANDWGDSLDEIGGLKTYNVGNDWYYWNFIVNDTYASEGIGSYKLQSNDKISLLYSYNNTKTQAADFDDDTAKNPDAAARTAAVENAKKVQSVLAQKIYDRTFEGGKVIPGIANANDLYAVYSLIRAGFEADKFYNAVYEKVSEELGTLAKGGSVKSTDGEISQESIVKDGSAEQTYAKMVLFVSALGKDASNINGFNLIEKMADKDVYSASSIYSKETTMLLAFDCAGYELPQGENYVTRADLVNAILSDIDNQIDISISYASIDSAVMAIQPLVKYQTADAAGVDKEAVKKACDKVLAFMYNMQSANGVYADNYSDNNAWTLAQVMITAGAFGIAPTSEADGSDLVKNGTTLFDVAASFVNVTDSTVDEKLMGFQPEQLLRGINACVRAEEGKESIFTIKDVPLPTQKEDKNTANSKLAQVKISKVKAGTKKISVTYKSVKGAKTYKVFVSTSKKFSKKTTTAVTTKKTTVTVKKLKSGKKYFVKVKAVNRKNSGKFSKTVTVKVK